MTGEAVADAALVDAAPRRRRGVVAVEVSLLVVAVVAVFVVSLLRMEPRTFDTLWAEDSTIFLVDALRPATSWHLVNNYAGYLHAVPRLIVNLVVAFVPLPLAGIAVTWAASFTVALVAGAVFWYSRSVIESFAPRLALAVATGLAPVASAEVLGNVANLHWYFLWLAPWLLLYLPRRWSGSVVAAVVALAATLTEIQMLVFAPLILWRLSERRRWPILVGFVLGLAAQIVNTLGHPRDTLGGDLPDAASTAIGYLYTVVLASVTSPGDVAGEILADSGVAVPVALFAGVVLAWLFVLVAGSWTQRVLALFLLPASVLIWTAGYVLNVREDWYLFAEFTREEWLAGQHPLRYAVVSSLFLVAVLVVAIDVLVRLVRRDPRRARAGVVVGVVLSALLIGVLGAATAAAGTTSLKNGRPIWSTQVETAEDRCETAPDRRRISVTTAPDPWFVVLTCEDIHRER